jgi:hypothetical protein
MKKIETPIKLQQEITELTKVKMTKIKGGAGHIGGDKRKKATGG